MSYSVFLSYFVSSDALSFSPATHSLQTKKILINEVQVSHLLMQHVSLWLKKHKKVQQTFLIRFMT